MTVVFNNEQPNIEDQKAIEKEVADNILNNFDLPESLANEINKAEENKGKEEVKEVKEEKEAEVAEEKPVEEEKEEELIPKSTFEKRLAEMTREKKLLELRLNKLEQEKTVQAKDEDTTKLEAMSETELQNLKKQVRISQLKNASDEAMVAKLFELEDKIDSVQKTAPQRFAQNQVRQFNDAVTLSAQEIPNFDKVQKDVFGLAKRIYDTAPELHSSVSGQARAWNLAVEHYKLLQETNAGKSKVEELGRQVNNLKRKVSVDGAVRKASQEVDSSEKLFNRAKDGTLKDKLEFVRKTFGTDKQVDSFMEKYS